MKKRLFGALLYINVLTVHFLSSYAQAGVFEVSATGNYRKSSVDEYNYSESQSLTGSIAYYFWAMSALELSYTQGSQKVKQRTTSGTGSSAINTDYTTLVDFTIYGADLVITLADRESTFIPYVKFGVAQQVKTLKLKVDNVDPITYPQQNATVPSAGLGLNIKLTQTFSIKIGGDAWFNGGTTDTAARAGLSWMF